MARGGFSKSPTNAGNVLGRHFGFTEQIAEEVYPTKKVELCFMCRFWDGPGKEVDHAHCKNLLSSNQTTSKYGNKEYDRCLYFKKR